MTGAHVPSRAWSVAFVVAGVLSIAVATRAAGAVDDTSVGGRLQHAERLAHQREHEAAIAAYRALLADGVGGAGVYYNLGTLLLDDAAASPERLGEAILMLKRAARDDPQQPDVWHNLAAAQALTVDRQSAESARASGPSLGARLPPVTVRWLFGAALGALGVLLGVEAARARFVPASHRAVVKNALRVATGIALASGAAYGVRRAFEDTAEAVVLQAEAPARKGPDPLADTAFIAHAGLTGVVTATEPGFVRLQLDNGLEAWLERDAVAMVKPAPDGAGG